MLGWRRVAILIAVLASARVVLALVGGEPTRPTLVSDAPPLLNETGVGGQESGGRRDNPAPPTPNPDSADSFTPSPEFQQWITNLVRQQLPENYEKRKNWGHTAKAFDGVSVKIEDGRLETRRKYKDAN